MICVQICSQREWDSLKELLDLKENEIENYPLGEYFNFIISDKKCIFYHSGATKTRSSAACQFAIDMWKPEKIFNIGTCGGVEENLNLLDIIIANKTVQYDCIGRMGSERVLFYEPFTTDIDNSWIDFTRIDEKINEGVIATADQDLNHEYLGVLREAGVLCADWESGAIAYICRLNNIKCCIIRGITDAPKKDDENSDINQLYDYRRNTPLVMKKLIKNILPSLLLMINET